MELEIVLALVLGAVHRQLGIAQQRGGIGAVAGVDADADTGREVIGLAVDLVRLCHCGEHPLCAGARRFRVIDLAKQCGEFIAAEARQQVSFAQALAQPASDLAKHHVAAVMAHGVVDQLEAVKVDEQHGD